MKARLLSILCILLMSLGILAQTKTRSADSWNYTVYEIADGQVVRTTKSTGEPNQEISVPYHRYNLLDGKLYLRGAAGGPKGLEYNHYFWLNEDGQTEYLGYEPTYITDVVYLAEGEDIPGMTLCDNDNMRIRSSNSAAAYAADGPVGFVTLPAGSYQLTAFIHSSHKNPDSYWSFFAGDKEIANLHCTVVNIQELQSEVFTLTEQTTLYIPQYGDERNGIDLLYITKAMPTIVANDLTMTYGSDVPTLTYTLQYTDNALDGAPKLSTTATKTSPVGTYPIKVEKGTVTGDNIIYVDGTLTITKAPLTVSVQDVTITRGDAIPFFSLTYDGWRNDDTEDIALIKKPTTKTVAQSDSPAGVYDIYVEGGEATNYALNYQSGKLTILPVSGDKWNDVGIKRQITHPQPMTGIAQWPYKARKVYATHGQSIQLEFHYFLPCKVVTGCKEDGTILYDWSSFDEELNDVASRGHQLVARFRYEYPESDDVDGKPGTTAVPNYIKQLPDYNETYSETYTTYYADWSNIDLQRFTLQFYTDFCQRYAHDPRLAFLEVGFGHWSEYHINAEPEYGKNFPSLEYQKTFLLNMSKVSDGLPWLVSKNAADNSPIAGDEELMALRFGLFEDSFMGEFFTRGGYEPNWNSMGGKTRWQTGVVGGENGDYDEQYNFLNPEGLFGHTFEEMIPKYHVTFLTIDHITDNPYVTPERLKQASIAMGYRFVVKKCATDGTKTLLLVRNEGIAPIYRDAYFAIGDVRSNTSLKGLLPNEEAWVEVDAKPRSDGKDIKIVSDFILPQQEIEFEADLIGNIKSSVVTAKSYSRMYGEDNPKFEYSVEGDTLDGTPEISCEATATSPVGTYDIVISQGDVSNYDVTYVNGTLTIEKAPLTVGVQNVTITEGDPIPSFTLTYSGFRNGDTESNAFSTKPTATTTATANSNPGTYPITISGGTATNYALNYTQGTLTVVAPSSNSYTYTVNEVVNSNVVRSTTGMESPNTELSVPYHRYNVLNGKLYLKNASGGSKGLEYNHYFTLTENNQVETINYEQTDVQDVVFLVEGEDIPGMTLCNNDNMRVRSSNSLAAYPANGPVGFVTLPVGSYRLTAFIHSSYKYPDSYWSFLAGDKEIANLHCTVVNIQELQSEIFTLNEKTTLYIPQCGDDRSGIDLLYITKEKYVEPVTITADNKTMNYGDDVPSLTYKSSSATLEGIPKLSTTATSSSPVGTYPIKVEQGTVSNGNVIYVDGTLTIEKAALTVGVQDVTITEGDAIPSFTLTYSGFRNGDTESNAFTTKPTAKTTATSSSTAGTYSITVSGGSAKNYALTYKQGTLTIEPAAGIESVYADGQGNVVIYNVNGQKLLKPQKGINIIGGKKVVLK